MAEKPLASRNNNALRFRKSDADGTPFRRGSEGYLTIIVRHIGRYRHLTRKHVPQRHI